MFDTIYTARMWIQFIVALFQGNRTVFFVILRRKKHFEVLPTLLYLKLHTGFWI